jgi:hypothetical protein
LEVWAALPAYDAPEVAVKLNAAPEPRPQKEVGARSRRMSRWHGVTKEMIAAAKEEGPEALDQLRDRLHAELETLFADAAPTIEVSSSDNTEWTETETGADGKGELVATIKNENSQNVEQNHENISAHVDSPVHVETAGAGLCVGCGVRLEPDEEEACIGCNPPRAPGQEPTAFRLIREQEEGAADDDVRELSIEYEEGVM